MASLCSLGEPADDEFGQPGVRVRGQLPYLTTIMLEGILVALGLAVACLWIAGRAFVRENA